MEEQVKIIEIPNFLKVKIVKINNKYCAYYVESYSDEYFYTNENDFLKIHSKDMSFWSLSINMPMVDNDIIIKHLEKDIYKLHEELTKDKIPRAEKDTSYYVIKNNFTVESFREQNDNIDNRFYKSYNYFLTENQAKRFASKMQNYIIELWKEELKNGN